MKKTLLLILIVAIAVGGGAFYGGMRYGQSKKSLPNFSGKNFQNLSTEDRQQFSQNGGTRSGSSFLNGNVLSKDNQSLTIKILDGGSKIIFLSASTTISKMTEGAINDIKVGKQVMVSGTQNSDGSYTANNIQIR